MSCTLLFKSCTKYFHLFITPLVLIVSTTTALLIDSINTTADTSNSSVILTSAKVV